MANRLQTALVSPLQAGGCDGRNSQPSGLPVQGNTRIAIQPNSVSGTNGHFEGNI